MYDRTPPELTSPANESEFWLPPPHERTPWFKSRRMAIFMAAFLLCITATLGYVFSQPAIYQSYATLLTVGKTAIDQPSNDADIQHVAIQKQVLLGSELLAETSKRLRSQSNNNNGGTNLSASEIRHMLDVRPVEETNLLEMFAEGPDPQKLPILINTWIDVYLDARAEEVSRLLGDTTQIIQDELTGLSEKINTKRAELDQFRKNSDIASLEREENEALAVLKGLNQSLNEANDEQVKAKARLDSINKSISRGEAVVPKEDTRTLSVLEDRAQELREELTDLNRRYTQEYLDLSPSLKVIPEQLALLEEEIKRMRQEGQTVVLSEARQEYAAAKQATDEIRAQLDAQKEKASEFSTQFAEHEALRTDLEGLEALYRETQERLVQIETRYNGKYPQVDVIERAFLPNKPVRPHYLLEAIIAVAGSILFSLFCVWISEFLTRKDHTKPVINLSGIHMYDNNLPPHALKNSSQNALDYQQTPALGHSTPIEISAEKINTLLQHAGNKEKLLIALLLSGATLEEIATLQKEDIDLENEKLTIKGKSPRTIPLNPALKSLFANPDCHLLHPAEEPLTADDLPALLTCAIIDAGIADADEINATSLRQTYIIYLVKQGIRLSELKGITGYIQPTELSSYSPYSPAGPKRSSKEIDLIYPELHKVKPA